jgi:sugar phosphate isomerase/epimerase
VQAASFRGLPLQPGRDRFDTLIAAIAAAGAADCELPRAAVEPAGYTGSAGHHSRMPPQMMRRELRKWRLRTPPSFFAAIGRRFRDAGIAIHAYDYSPDATFADEEIDRGFTIAKALGAEMLTASVAPAIAARIAPFADRHRMLVALTGGAAGSRFFRLRVDVGELTAEGIDAVAYIREHHDAIASLSLTDWRRGAEPAAWGQGDAPIGDVLRLIGHEGWPIAAYVNCEPRGGSAIEEVRRCLTYARRALG